MTTPEIRRHSARLQVLNERYPSGFAHLQAGQRRVLIAEMADAQEGLAGSIIDAMRGGVIDSTPDLVSAIATLLAVAGAMRSASRLTEEVKPCE